MRLPIPDIVHKTDMAPRCLRQFTCVQTLLIFLVCFLVLLDIRFRLDPASIESFRIDADYDEYSIEDAFDDKVSFTASSMARSYSKNGSRQPAGKFRRPAWHDIPPEHKPGWIGSDKEIPLSRFPKSLLVGFSKCGTSSLLSFLNFHPDIVSLDWETDYFCDRVYFKYSLHWYRMRMPVSTRSQVTIEKSPCYITERQALERVKAFNSSIKVMVILRNPLTRILSQHGQYLNSFKTVGKKLQPIEERYVDPKTGELSEYLLQKWGVYTSRMENLFSIFPRGQIHVIDGDRFIKDPLPVLSEVERFLGVRRYFTRQDFHLDPSKGFFCPRSRSDNSTECMGLQKGRPHVLMPPKLRPLLVNYLRPFNERLFNLIGRKLDWDMDA